MVKGRSIGLSDILICDGYFPKAASKMLDFDLLEFDKKLRDTLKKKALLEEEYKSLEQDLETLIQRASEKKMDHFVAYLRSALEKLRKKDVGVPVSETEYVRAKAYSKRAILTALRNWAEKHYSRVAVFPVEKPVPKQLGEFLRKYGPCKVYRDAENPYKLLIVSKVYRKAKGQPMRLGEKVIGEIIVEP